MLDPASPIFITFISLFLFLFTLAFSYSYKLLKIKHSISNLKCFAGGIILSAMIFHIFPDIYENDSSIAPFFSGISFLMLFWLDKLYLCQCEHDTLPDTNSLKKAIIFVLALSVHSFLEGTGIATKTGKQLFFYMLGLVGHKWAEAFALGISIVTAPFSKRGRSSLIILYSSLTSLGCIAGYVIIKIFDKPKEVELIKKVLTGVSSGSFFYIGFIEMLNSEFESGHKTQGSNMNKLTSITTGFGLMTMAVLVCDYFEKKNAAV